MENKPKICCETYVLYKNNKNKSPIFAVVFYSPIEKWGNTLFQFTLKFEKNAQHGKKTR
jgi:hypothetical protein